ncbi:MAG: hypothetical protein Q9199_006185 [Rusavskia elegans]
MNRVKPSQSTRFSFDHTEDRSIFKLRNRGRSTKATPIRGRLIQAIHLQRDILCKQASHNWSQDGAPSPHQAEETDIEGPFLESRDIGKYDLAQCLHTPATNTLYRSSRDQCSCILCAPDYDRAHDKEQYACVEDEFSPEDIRQSGVHGLEEDRREQKRYARPE